MLFASEKFRFLVLSDIKLCGNNGMTKWMESCCLNAWICYFRSRNPGLLPLQLIDLAILGTAPLDSWAIQVVKLCSSSWTITGLYAVFILYRLLFSVSYYWFLIVYWIYLTFGIRTYMNILDLKPPKVSAKPPSSSCNFLVLPSIKYKESLVYITGHSLFILIPSVSLPS